MATAVTATCITCSTVFRDRDEDGAPEIPGVKCAQADCEVWICDGGCAEHFSFECECGRRFCADHRVRLHGMNLCPECATREWNTCFECGAAGVAHRLKDTTGLCAKCYPRLQRTNARYPRCPACHERWWVSPLQPHGWWRCLGPECGGLKFDPQSGGFDGIPRQQSAPMPRIVAFQPRVALP